MTNYTLFDVAVFKGNAIRRAAQMLGLPDDFLGPTELLDHIQVCDAEAKALLEGFFAIYDKWYELSSEMIKSDEKRASHQGQLENLIKERDDARQRLIAHLNKHQI